ncbi:hypothetical protein VNO77_46331 [Canavalia gladiata]|uniref:Uncharacterized protein n=1 Tax=Canavalia gladiata TaxID=3824 RepID=A0AAN9JIW9_CANGL
MPIALKSLTGPYATYIGLDFFDFRFHLSVSNPISSKAFSSPHRCSSKRDFGKEFLSLRTMIDSPFIGGLEDVKALSLHSALYKRIGVLFKCTHVPEEGRDELGNDRLSRMKKSQHARLKRYWLALQLSHLRHPFESQPHCKAFSQIAKGSLVYEDLQVVKQIQTSAIERIVAYHPWKSKGIPRGGIEGKKRTPLLDWISCQLFYQRPIQTKQLFLYGPTNTQSSFSLSFQGKTDFPVPDRLTSLAHMTTPTYGFSIRQKLRVDAWIFHKKKERTCRTHRQPTTTLNQYTGKIDSNAFSTTHSRTQREQGDSKAKGLHQQETQTTLRFNITAGRQIHENEFFIQPRIDRSINGIPLDSQKLLKELLRLGQEYLAGISSPIDSIPANLKTSHSLCAHSIPQQSNPVGAGKAVLVLNRSCSSRKRLSRFGREF